jgi:hypothetical protein
MADFRQFRFSGGGIGKIVLVAPELVKVET